MNDRIYTTNIQIQVTEKAIITYCFYKGSGKLNLNTFSYLKCFYPIFSLSNPANHSPLATSKLQLFTEEWVSALKAETESSCYCFDIEQEAF